LARSEVDEADAGLFANLLRHDGRQTDEGKTARYGERDLPGEASTAFAHCFYLSSGIAWRWCLVVAAARHGQKSYRSLSILRPQRMNFNLNADSQRVHLRPIYGQSVPGSELETPTKMRRRATDH
jgi:hypothetical protein